MDKHSAATCSELMRLVHEYVDMVGELCPERRTGGAFHCRHVHDSFGWLDAHATMLAGTYEEQKALKYWEFAQEKADRLANHFGEGHLSSYQSRAPEKMRWGGAIRTPGGWILSFSGFPELMDEAFMLAVARQAGLITVSEAITVLAPHGKQEQWSLVTSAMFYD